MTNEPKEIDIEKIKERILKLKDSKLESDKFVLEFLTNLIRKIYEAQI